MGSYPIGVVGESFANDDGSSRQAEIRRCAAGEAVTLERDPANRFDSNCVRVVSERGIQIGNISRDDDWIAERIDRGGFIDAQILSIGSGERGSGVVLCVRTTAEDAWMESSAGGGGGRGCAGVLAAAVLLAGLIASVPQAGAAPPQVSRGIDTFCKSAPACVAAQRESLRHFLGITVMFDAPEAEAARCMRAGQRGKTVDWTLAERCIRSWSKGRPPLLSNPERG